MDGSSVPAPIHQPRLVAHGMSIPEALHRIGERAIELSRADEVHEGEALVQRDAHDIFAVGSTEDDGDAREALLDPVGEAQARHVLLEERRESDDVIAVPRDARHPVLQEGLDVILHLDDAQAIVGRHEVEHLRRVLLVRRNVTPEQRVREHLFSGQERRELRNRVVAFPPHHAREDDVEIADVAPDAIALEARLEQPERQRRIAGAGKRHC